MSVQYQLEPDVPDTVRVTDDASGTSRLVYDPNQAAQLRLATAAPTPAVAPIPLAQPGSDAPVPIPAAPIATPQVMDASSTMPPPASDAAVASYNGAPQPAPPAPIVRASGNPPPPPQPGPPGLTLLKADVKPGSPGYAYNQDAEDKRANKTIDRNLELQRQSDAVTGILNQQDIELGKQQAEDRAAQQQEEAKASRYEAELKAANKELDPGRLVKQEGIGGAILGLVGLAVAGFSKAPGLAMSRMNASLDARIARDINIQKEQKDSTLNLLTRQLGNAQQAAAMYRAGVRKAAFDRLGVQLKSQGTYNQYSDLMQAGRDELDTLNDQARQLSYGKPGAVEYQYGIPKPVKGTGEFVPTDASSQEINRLFGPKGQEMYLKAMQDKVGSGQNAPTVQAALPMIHQMQEDESTLHSLAAENGGHIPTKGVMNVPQFLVGPLSKMGYQPGMKAEEANQIIQNYVSQKARSYGGVITDSDRKQAELEMGQSGDGLLRGIGRMKEGLNNSTRQVLATHFHGNADRALQISLRDYAGTPGVPDTSPVPFDVHNGPAESDTAPAAPPPPDDPAVAEKKARRARLATRPDFGF